MAIGVVTARRAVSYATILFRSTREKTASQTVALRFRRAVCFLKDVDGVKVFDYADGDDYHKKPKNHVTRDLKHVQELVFFHGHKMLTYFCVSRLHGDGFPNRWFVNWSISGSSWDGRFVTALVLKEISQPSMCYRNFDFLDVIDATDDCCLLSRDEQAIRKLGSLFVLVFGPMAGICAICRFLRVTIKHFFSGLCRIVF